ncbi:MAG: SIMPL domain-containing protein [Chlamydiota bacterium]|nr:SIMPL domain-containing protein [Chlamydiota bacterium]
MHWIVLFAYMTLSFGYSSALEAIKEQGLTITGSATLLKPADLLSISLGVTTEGQDAEVTLEENSAKMQQLILALNKIGIEKPEYKTGSFSITPLYAQPPKNPPSNWQSHITGYRVINTLIVMTDKLKMAGTIIDAASGAGANNINSIEFSIKDNRDYRAEAISTASANALSDARTLAEATGVTLTNIRSVTLDPQQNLPMYKRSATLMSYDGNTPIEAGDIEIKASVHIVYDINN